MADQYVALRLRATDEAKPDLEDLKARLDELKGKVATARADVDDVHADAKLAGLEARLETLSKRVVSPRIDMAGGARAVAEMLAVEAAMSKTADEAAAGGERAGRRYREGFKLGARPALIGGGILGGLAMLPAAAAGLGALAGAGFAAHFLIGTKNVKGKAATEGPLYDSFRQLTDSVHGLLEKSVTPMIAPLKQAFTSVGKFAKQIEPELKSTFGAIGPLVMPMVKGLEGAVKGLLPGFESLMKAAKPAVGAIGSVLSSLGTGLGGMLSSLAPAISASGQFLKAFGSALAQMMPSLGELVTVLVQALVPVLPMLVRGFAGFVSLLSGGLGRIVGDLATGIAAISRAVPPLIPALLGIVAAVKAWKIAQALLDIVLTANPIGLVITAIGALIVIVVEIVKHWGALKKAAGEAFGFVARAARSMWHHVAGFFTGMRHDIERAVGGVIGWIRGHWPLLLAIFTGPIGLAVYAIKGHFSQIMHGAQSLVSSVTGFFKSLPGRIIHAIGDLAGMLYKAGVNAIKGLLSGAASMIGSAKSTLAGWGHDLINALGSPFGIHFSEPSEAAQMIKAGRQLPLGLAKGVTMGMPDFSRVMERVAAVGSGRGRGYGGGYGAPGAGVLRIQLEWAGGAEDDVARMARKYIRIRGGNVQKVLGIA